MTAISILFIGFLLGMKHATEADHLAAVATLATQQSSFAQTMVQGAAWGVGHTATSGWVAFIRGINVGGNKIIPMKELARACTALGFREVRTYLARDGDVI